ncbi:hypothetical protein FJY84_06845 [Candidatus Bathyarchaeota archaeon]|nr:hypothetical protein [Candidatus Bathyarchaeota archaeon]
MKFISFYNTNEAWDALSADERCKQREVLKEAGKKSRIKLGVKQLFVGTSYATCESYIYACEADN